MSAASIYQRKVTRPGTRIPSGVTFFAWLAAHRYRRVAHPNFATATFRAARLPGGALRELATMMRYYLRIDGRA